MYKIYHIGMVIQAFTTRVTPLEIPLPGRVVSLWTAVV